MVFATAEARDLVVREHGAIEGGNQTIGRLATYLDTLPTHELVITRVFDAPRDLVFKTWTDPAHAKHWWGPREYPASELEMDARPGGMWRARLKSTAGEKDLWHSGVFREVVAPERIVFTFAWDEMGERGLETVVTVTLKEQGRKTHMTFHQAPFRSSGVCEGHEGGWGSCFDRLAEKLAKQCEAA
ncbi:MAG: SRPBCC domain-containing protein [Candidatus Hydrogenedentes bacterium]|nr:SRPBCC domain-containing protein [Candidatus Hydrogenedentota bacterium]